MIDSTKTLDPQVAILSKFNANLKLKDSILDNKYIKKGDIPILILLNKVDVSQFDDYNHLNNLLDFSKLNLKSYNVMAVSAIKGKGIREALHWIFYSMCNSISTETEDNFDPMLNMA